MKRFAIAMLLVLAAGAHADVCVGGTEPWSALSKNGEWRFDASPARSRDGWRGALSQKTPDGAWRRRARWTLVNPRRPAGAAVANDGTVVTFDHICNARAVTDVIVIYRPDGTLVRSLGLADLLIDDDVALLPRSVSSIHWLRELRLEDDMRRLVIDFEEPRPQKNVEVPVSLDTGELLTPRRRRFVGFPTLDPVVSFRADEALAARAASAVAAAYPPVAIKARISGDVIAEVVVDESGGVESVKMIEPLPFGLDQATDTALRAWRFRPGERITGRVVMSFGVVTQPPPPVD